ncbi:Clp protease N-terminal domain-containing protein [Micromonosporaceae bacterium Da 78-11]
MFERFTQEARDTVIRAQTEARELHRAPIGTEHLLLALLHDDTGPVAAALRDSGVDAAFVRDDLRDRVDPHPTVIAQAETDAEDKAALKAIGIDLDAVRAAIEENFGAGALRLPRAAPAAKKRKLFGLFTTGTGHIPFSDRSKKVLELSLREALRLKQKFIAPEHIMLGILREGNGLAMLILTDKGVDLDRLRAELTRSLDARAA